MKKHIIFVLGLFTPFVFAAKHQKVATELRAVDVKAGKGEEAKSGRRLTVHYKGKLTNGKVFDTSKKAGRQPFQFVVGAGQVIQGWDIGILGDGKKIKPMKVGGKRKLTIPPSLGYGDRPAGEIPPNSTLIFDVELLAMD